MAELNENGGAGAAVNNTRAVLPGVCSSCRHSGEPYLGSTSKGCPVLLSRGCQRLSETFSHLVPVRVSFLFSFSFSKTPTLARLVLAGDSGSSSCLTHPQALHVTASYSSATSVIGNERLCTFSKHSLTYTFERGITALTALTTP